MAGTPRLSAINSICRKTPPFSSWQLQSKFSLQSNPAAAAVAFEEEDLQLLLQPSLTIDSVGFLLRLLSAGSWAGGFRGGFRSHGGLSFFGFAAAGRGRGCGEAGDRSIVVGRLAPADFRSVAYLRPPCRAFGAWRQLAKLSVAGYKDLRSTEKGQHHRKLWDGYRTGRADSFLREQHGHIPYFW